MADRMSRETLIIQTLVAYSKEGARAEPVRSGLRGIRQWEVFTGPNHFHNFVGNIFLDVRSCVWMADPAREKSTDHKTIQDAVRELMKWA
jgi:hypothetical protein